MVSRAFLAGAVCALALLTSFFSSTCFAEDKAPGKPLEDVTFAKTADQAKLAGDNAWMLTSAALVLFMTAPGLAMFYGGLVRRKNVLSILMQCIFLMALMTTLWAIYGYSLAFAGTAATAEVKDEAGKVTTPAKAGTGNPWIGTFDFLGMNKVQATLDPTDGKYDFPLDWTKTIPCLTHMLFQGMFFIITPALICGAFAERMKFSTMVVFMILWGTIVYIPLAHWVWHPEGVFFYGSAAAGQYTLGGALDFAGGTVVHISSGVSALVCALVIGRRLGYGTEDMRPHNITYTAIGAGMLWVGWFGFNGGSAGGSNGLAASAFCVTHFAAATGAIGWAAMEWWLRGKPSVLGAASGAVAGLVVITPASGFVQPMPALVMGLAAGIVCFSSCSWLKSKLGYDDSLDAFGVHGVGGTLGAILTGVFATKAVNSLGGDGIISDPANGWKLLVAQIMATVLTWILAAVVTFVLLKILDATMGLRVDQKSEMEGLDVSEHGEEGYIFN